MLMGLYMASGRRDLALQQYEMLRDYLQRELNITPEPETSALHHDILDRLACNVGRKVSAVGDQSANLGETAAFNVRATCRCDLSP